MNPLLEAVIAGDIAAVQRLKNSQWRFTQDPLGFTPYELAGLLGHRKIEAIFSPLPPQEDFENRFGVTYRSHLTFSSYLLLQEVVDNCPYLLRFPWLTPENYAGAARYSRQLAMGMTAPLHIQWIDESMGWGAFAAKEIAEGSFVGEYTGVVRRIDTSNPDLNDYCFHYPTKLWSRTIFVIDAGKEGNAMRFVNHSDTPNLKPYCFVERRLLHLCFLASRKILEGEQLTFDYGNHYWRHRKKELVRV